MPVTTSSAPLDRSDLRTVTLGGAQLGGLTALAVVAFLAASRLPADRVALARGIETLIVLAAAVAVSFLPAQWSGARHVEGIAGAAALGFVGTLVFSVIDIVALRPLKAYPWTWDAIGGGSSWWYLPVWWMLGTFLAWMGGIVTARQAARGAATLGRAAGPTLVATLVAVTLARGLGLAVALPVLAGLGWTVVVALLAVVALARPG
jgi:hypothetical protein